MLRVEPSVVRAKDGEAGRFRATIDNSDSNQSRRVTLTGRDTEGVVRFIFIPGRAGRRRPVEPPAPTSGSRRPRPEPGQQATRQLTVIGRRRRDAGGVDRHLPAGRLGRGADGAAGRAEPGPGAGQRDRAAGDHHRQPAGHPDPAGVSRRPGSGTAWSGSRSSPPSIDVFAGEVGRARLRIEAPQPPAGQESSRALTRAGDLGGHPGSGGHRHVRADDIGRAGRHPGGPAAGPQRGPGPGHRRRAAGGDHRQPRRLTGCGGCS